MVKRLSALPKLAELRSLGMRARETTGSGTNIEVSDCCTEPSVKVVPLAQSTPSYESRIVSLRARAVTWMPNEGEDQGECKGEGEGRDMAARIWVGMRVGMWVWAGAMFGRERRRE